MKKISWKKNLVMLWLSQLIVMAGFSAMIPFIPLFIKNRFGITEEGDVAFYVSYFNFFGTLAYAVFCPIWGKLADRFGVKPMLLRGTFATSWMFPLMAYVPSAAWLIVVRFFSAACAGTTAASQVMIAKHTPDDRQGFAQGVLTTAIWGGAMLGYVAGGLIIHYFSYTCAFWLCGISYIFAGVAIVFTDDDFSGTVQRKNIDVVRIKGILPFVPVFTRVVWILLGLFMFLGVVRHFEAPYVALKIEEITGSAEAAYWTGIVSACACVGAILSGVVNGFLADRLSPLKLLVPLLVFSALAQFMQGVSSGLVFFTVSRTMLYIAAGGLPPILQKQLSAVTPKRKRGAVFGFSSACLSSGGMIAALAAGWSMMLFKVNGVFYSGAVLFLLCIPVFVPSIRKVLIFSHRNG